MSLNVEINLPFQEAYSSSQSILFSLRVLEHSKRCFLGPYDLNERKQKTLKLRELWTQVLTQCKTKLQLNSAIICLLKAKQMEYTEKFDSLKHELTHTLYLYGESLLEYRDQDDYDSAEYSFESLNDDNEIARILPPHKENPTEFGNLERGLRHNESALRGFQNYETDKVFEYLNNPVLYNNRDLEDRLEDIFRQIDDLRRFLFDLCDNIYSAWVSMDRVTVHNLGEIQNEIHEIGARLSRLVDPF